MQNKLLKLLGYTLLALTLTACKQDRATNNQLKIGTIAGPESSLMETAQKVAKKRYQLNIKIITFTDYIIPNVALNDGSIDANMFQHQPYLDATVKARKYKLVSIGKMFIYPMGVYSNSLKNLANIKPESTIAIPNDPSNEARALLLLQKAKLITLKPNITTNASVLDIQANPKKLKFKQLNAAQLPRVLNDVDAAVINTNFAIPAGLNPKRDAIFLEGKDSLYANIVVVRQKDLKNPKFKKQFKQLMISLHSQPVRNKAKALFKDGAIKAW